MHIYYYQKDGHYYVMNKNGILEKYSVKNNIELILKSENLISYFTMQLQEDNTKFRFKSLQEMTTIEIYKLFEMVPLLALIEYNALQESTLPAYILQISLINIINKIYDTKKTTIQKAEKLLEDLLTELLEELHKKTDDLKQISKCKKEIAPLSELDPHAKKIYIDSQAELIDSIQYDIDFQIDAELNTEDIFKDNEDENNIDYENISNEDLHYLIKIQKMKNRYLNELPDEIQKKLDFNKTKNLRESSYLIANITIGIAMISQIISQNMNDPSLDKYQKTVLPTIIILDIIYSSIYYKANKKLKNTNEPYLRLKKQDK